MKDLAIPYALLPEKGKALIYFYFIFTSVIFLQQYLFCYPVSVYCFVGPCWCLSSRLRQYFDYKSILSP